MLAFNTYVSIRRVSIRYYLASAGLFEEHSRLPYLPVFVLPSFIIMAKDKKSKAAEKKARVAAKQNKKAAQKEQRVRSKGTEDSDAEDVDLESVLAEYAEKVRTPGSFY